MNILDLSGQIQYVIPGGSQIAELPSWWLSGDIDPEVCVAAWQAKGAANYAASLVNLANPGTYDCTEGVAPTFAGETGWTSNGTKYLKTGIIPTSTMAVIVQFSGILGVNNDILGAFDVASIFSGLELIPITNTGKILVYWGDGENNITGAGITSGNICVAGKTSAVRTFKNGAFINQINATYSAIDLDMWLLANNYGDFYGGIIGNIQAVAVYDPSPTDEQLIAVMDEMSAL